MSLIIKGIDLPKEGNDECKMLTVDIFPSGNIQVREQGDGCCDGYSLDKSAIQIPKGARLIDANEISKDLEEWKQRPNNDDDAVVLVNHFQGIIRTALTILESEED